LTTIWSPDTCDCKLEYDNNFRFIKYHNKCRLHNRFRNQVLLDRVTAQNQRFNLSYPNPNERQQQVISESKRVNRNRIRTEQDLNNFDEHLPHEPFFSALRSLLRL